MHRVYVSQGAGLAGLCLFAADRDGSGQPHVKMYVFCRCRQDIRCFMWIMAMNSKLVL